MDLKMSELISTDLLSPTDSHPDLFYDQPDSPIPLSPLQFPELFLKSSSPGDSMHNQLCLPTHQLFGLPNPSPTIKIPPQVKPTIAQEVDHEMDEASMELMSDSVSPLPHKREASPPAVPPTKKVRGERISSKDFIPPDVSGMSKREARLVKNRAAAFLSRQRKREEFETMEIRVGELEEENARLLALTQGAITNASAAPHSQETSSSAVSEIEQLRAELAAAQERERQLYATIAAVSTSTASASAVTRTVKREETPIVLPPAPPTPPVPSSRSSFPSASSAIKSGTGLGLMVLLCALPNILSMPSHHHSSHSMPTSSFSSAFESALPLSPTSGFDINSFIAGDHDWSRSNIMDLDLDDQHRDLLLELPSTPSATTALDTSNSIPASSSAQSPQSQAASRSGSTQKLHISNSQLPVPLNNLQGVDISFDAVPGEDGKITVRILPPGTPNGNTASGVSAPSSRASSVRPSSPSPWTAESATSTSGPMTAASFPDFSSSPPSVHDHSSPLAHKDPFLGVGDNLDSAMGGDYYGLGKWSQGYHAQGDPGDDLGSVFELGSDSGVSLDSWGASSAGVAGKRRVRVTLKSLPSDETGEGGEWEVQFC